MATNNHKVTITRSLKYSDTYDIDCTCGFHDYSSKTKFYTSTMARVLQEAKYIKQDHLNDNLPLLADSNPAIH